LFKIIENKLATQGIQQFSYRVLNEGNHQTNEFTAQSWPVVDVRDLYDDGSSKLEVYEKKIDLSWQVIQNYGRVVVCCVAGVNRSNAIALGVLVKYFEMDFDDAMALIRKKVPIANIDLLHIVQLKKLLKLE
jgi:protein-tyrosine phosphatase